MPRPVLTPPTCLDDRPMVEDVLERTAHHRRWHYRVPGFPGVALRVEWHNFSIEGRPAMWRAFWSIRGLHGFEEPRPIEVGGPQKAANEGSRVLKDLASKLRGKAAA
jgi:hypothetical protein